MEWEKISLYFAQPHTWREERGPLWERSCSRRLTLSLEKSIKFGFWNSLLFKKDKNWNWTGSLEIWTKESQDPWHCSKVRNSKDGSGFLSRISCRSNIRAQKHYYGVTSSYYDGILDLEELISERVDQLQVDYPQARWAEQLAEHPLCYTSPPKHRQDLRLRYY